MPNRASPTDRTAPLASLGSAASSEIGSRAKLLRRIVSQLGFGRLILTMLLMVLALLAARFGPQLPLLVDAERALYDMRATIGAPHVAQDSRIAMITYTDDVLIKRRIRSPLDRQLLAETLKVLDGVGAKSIGIDILFDQAADHDEELQAQLRAMRTPTYLAYAEPKSNPGDIQQRQADFLEQFLSSVETPVTRRASIRLVNDGDDSYRRWPGRAPGSPQLMTVAMANMGDDFASYHGAVRWRMPAQVAMGEGADVTEVFENIPIDTYTNPELMTPDMRGYLLDPLRGKHLLIGGDIIGTDEFDTPVSGLPDPVTGEPKKMIGLEVHAHMLAQILDQARLVQIPGWAMWLAALLAIAAGALTALLDMAPWKSLLLMLTQLAIILVAPILLQIQGIDTLDLSVAGAGAGWFMAFVGATSAVRAVGAEERSFAQSALGKYLPRDIAQEILRDPDRLALHGEKRPIYCLFSDLEGFTKMSHAMPPENVAFVLNAYLDTLSDVVLAHGGTIDKFVGDAVVAFWGAPIARPDDAEQAAKALVAMAEAGEAFRARMAQELGGTLPPIGRTRVGLHYGEAVVGNFGGEGRIQYTALGDSMNTAARLEGANKPMQTAALISREAAESCGLDYLVPMGRVELRGRSQPVDVFEPRRDLSPEQRAAIAALVAAHDGGKGAAFDAALAEAERLLPGDASTGQLILRLKATAPGAAYALS